MGKIHLIRHAQASYLSDNYDQLSDLGIDQSKDLGLHFLDKAVTFDKVFIGPLFRHRQTHDFALSKYNFYKGEEQNPIILEGLTEHLAPETLRTMLPSLRKTDPFIKEVSGKIEANPSLKRTHSLIIFDYFIKKWASGEFVDPNIQSWSAFKVIVENTRKQIIQSMDKGQKVAIFTSGGTIAAMLSSILEIHSGTVAGSINSVIKNTSVHTVLVSQNRLSLESFNDVSHLDPSKLTTV